MITDIVHIIVGSCSDPSLQIARLTSPGGEGNGNAGLPSAPFCAATRYTPSLDPSVYNASPNVNAVRPGPSLSEAIGYTPSLDSSAYNVETDIAVTYILFFHTVHIIVGYL